MKILVVSTCRSFRYFRSLIEEIGVIDKSITTKLIYLGEYLFIDQNEYDVLIYNTFPDETHWKFDRELTSKCDEKFYAFKGLRILLDTHDNGSKDGFARFNEPQFPRIKTNPSYDVIDKMNLVLIIPYFVSPSYCNPQKERTNRIVCALNTKGMPFVRGHTYERIEQFDPDNKWLPLRKHARRLCQTLINVVPTGTGDSSKSHTATLAAGALLMAEENIKDIKILPYADLRESRHFVSFDLDNICDKLDYLLSHRERLDFIREKGLNAFKTGYDCNRNAKQLLEWIRAQ